MGGTHEENAVGSQTPRASNLLEPAPVARTTIPTWTPTYTTHVDAVLARGRRHGRPGPPAVPSRNLGGAVDVYGEGRVAPRWRPVGKEPHGHVRRHRPRRPHRRGIARPRPLGRRPAGPRPRALPRRRGSERPRRATRPVIRPTASSSRTRVEH